MAYIVPQILLLLLAAWGFWTLWGFPYTNGLLEILGDLQKPGASIPGPTKAPMKQIYTGIKPIDFQLTNLVGFFYTAIDGNRADVSLAGLDLGGNVIAGWVLFTVEGLRYGNKGMWYLTSTTLLGLLLQNIGFACIAPIWMAIHLWTSPTVLNPTMDELVVQPLQLAVAPVSIGLGYGIPSVIMCLAAPAKISFAAKQAWTGAQQAWPIWIAAAQALITTLVSVNNSMVNVMTEDDRKIRTLTYLRLAYGFALISSTAGHLISHGLTDLAYAFPVLFNPTYAEMMQPFHVFSAQWPFSDVKVDTLADGALWFLQWDVITGAAAVLIWAVTLRMGVEKSKPTYIHWVVGLVISALPAIAVGLSGAAVIAMWTRDETVFRQWEESKEKALVKKGK